MQHSDVKAKVEIPSFQSVTLIHGNTREIFLPSYTKGLVMRSEILPFHQPSIGEEEVAEVVDTLRSGWITTGPKVKKFEAQFTDYVSASEALAIGSCTAGLHLSLAALGIGPGDEVITTTLTFAASVNVIEHVGAKPVLVDVDPATLNIDIQSVKEAISPRTKAVIAVHFAGHPVDLDALSNVLRPLGIPIVEDAAHAIGASYQGRPIGHGENLTSFSFYATKNLTTAEGGMLTGPSHLVERARTLSLHGLSRDAWQRYTPGANWRYDVVAPGFKYNMTDLQASIGIWQLRKFVDFQRRRGEIAERYNQAFSNYEFFEIPAQRDDIEHAWHLYTLRLRPEYLTIDRDSYLQELLARKIGTSVHFIPVHTHPYYRDRYGYCDQDFPIAMSNFERMFSLPLHPQLTDDDVTDVIEAVIEIGVGNRKRLAS